MGADGEYLNPLSERLSIIVKYEFIQDKCPGESSLSATMFQHFYYGQLIRQGRADGGLQLLAISDGIPSTTALSVARSAVLPPLAGTLWGSLGLIRAGEGGFALIQSQFGGAGQVLMHYVLIPTDVLRGLGGNLKALLSLVHEQGPVIEKAGISIKPLQLHAIQPMTTDEQVDEILTLMGYTRDRLEVIESLLAAIVQGIQVVVTGAPIALTERVMFVQGLLALLPPSVRFGVTFATHAAGNVHPNAQICFWDDIVQSPESLIYGWGDPRTGGRIAEDDYSRFIVSQLRLDAELVIQQTTGLKDVAAWRIKRGERLSEALDYASKRLRLDQAILNSQPIEMEEVARVLTEDPTLTEDLRVAYARHLLAFSLALGNSDNVEPIAAMLRQLPALERDVLTLMGDALKEGKSDLVYQIVSRWLANPLGPTGNAWVKLTHQAVLMQTDAMVKARDNQGVTGMLEHIQQTDPGVEMHLIVPRLIEMTLPLSTRDKTLADTLFLLALNYLDVEMIRKLLNTKAFAEQLRKGMARLIAYLNRTEQGAAPTGLLASVAESFGPQWQMVVMIRMSEAAAAAGRLDLFDTSALSELQKIAGTEWGRQYDQILRWIVQQLMDERLLRRLEEPGPRYLLQILLARGAYTELAQGFLHQARTLYLNDRQADYLRSIQHTFSETHLPAEEALVALKGIRAGGIKLLPLAMAYIGALEGENWSPLLAQAAGDVTDVLFSNQTTMLQVIDLSAMLALLTFHVKQQDKLNAVKVASLMLIVAEREGEDGVQVMVRMFRLMTWDPEVQEASLELLRRYIRQLSEEAAQEALLRFGQELGPNIREVLEVTHALNLLMGGVGFDAYAQAVHTMADFLEDTALAYSHKNDIPSLKLVRGDLDSSTGGTSDVERRTLSLETLGMARTLVDIYHQHRAAHPRDNVKHIEALCAGSMKPMSVLDVFWAIGGFFAKGHRIPVDFEQTNSHPLGVRSAPLLLAEMRLIHLLMKNALHAFSALDHMTLDFKILRGEIESLWEALSLNEQREIVQDLATDLQRISDLVLHIGENGDEKAVQDGPLGRGLDTLKNQPRSTLEFYRFVHGYFGPRM